jgi:hypothetical protein
LARSRADPQRDCRHAGHASAVPGVPNQSDRRIEGDLAPFLFKSHAHQQAFFRSEIFKPALDKLRNLGGLVIDEDWTWWQMDPRGLVSVRPVKTPDELKGLKLRIWESRTAIATWQGFGAETRVVPRPEMYLAFKQGIIEGGPETIGIAVDQKNVEVAKHWTRTDEYFQILNILVNARAGSRSPTRNAASCVRPPRRRAKCSARNPSAGSPRSVSAPRRNSA